MISITHTLRVRYAETDPMKYVYYGHYATYLETARVELFRSLGMAYSEIEDRGIWLPVSELNINYIKPARYDDELKIKTRIEKLPQVRIRFDYEIYNANNELLTRAFTTLYFFDVKKNKPVGCPDFLLTLMRKHFSNKTE